MAYVYRHIRVDKNEVFYIGIGSDKFYRRAREKRLRNVLWNRIANKTNFEWEILFDNVSWDEAANKEKEFIALYGKIIDGTGTLANFADGGEGTYGVFHTEATKLKIKDKRKIQPPTNAKPIIQYDLDGKFISKYDSANDIERKLGIVASNITAACRKRQNGKYLYKKYIWRYENEVLNSEGGILLEIPITVNEKYLGRMHIDKGKWKNTKLNWVIVAEIRKSKLTGRELSKIYNVSSTVIYNIKNNVMWKV